MRSILLVTEQCTRYFFNATHQVKTIAIGTSKDKPLVKIVSVFLFLRSKRTGSTFPQTTLKDGYTHTQLPSIAISYHCGISFCNTLT